MTENHQRVGLTRLLFAMGSVHCCDIDSTFLTTTSIVARQYTLLSLMGLLLYSFIGAGIFLALELPEQEHRWARRRQRYLEERLQVVEDIVGECGFEKCSRETSDS